MANCMTLARMVIAPTARSPPYWRRLVLKQTLRMLSVNCMIKGDTPRARQGRRIFRRSRSVRRCKRRVVRFPRRKHRIHRQEAPWDSTVARAAPCTPMSRAKMKMGSSTMLHPAPRATVSIPVRAKPWALMKALSPRASWTKRVPTA